MQRQGGEAESPALQEEALAPPPATRPPFRTRPPTSRPSLASALLLTGLAAHVVCALVAVGLFVGAPRLFPLAPPTACPPDAPRRIIPLSALPLREDADAPLTVVEEAQAPTPEEDTPPLEAAAASHRPLTLTAHEGECLVLEVYNGLSLGALQLEVEGLSIRPGPAAPPDAVHRLVVPLAGKPATPAPHALWAHVRTGGDAPEQRVPVGLLLTAPAPLPEARR